jgi:hypothetical protein
MPPRRSARVAAVVDRETSALSPLPLSVVLHIFSLLPLHTRLRCAEVCRGWRAVVSTRSLWTRLNVSEANGFVRTAIFCTMDGVLRSASARASGGLQSLTVDTEFVSLQQLLRVAADNAGALQELRVLRSERPMGRLAWRLEVDALRQLLHAAPQLRTLAADLYGADLDVQAVRTALRNEAPFGPLRVRHLRTTLDGVDEAGLVSLTADVAAHASLTWLTLEHAPLHMPAAINAVVDAALACQLQTVSIVSCGLSPASAPALARLLSSDALTTLELCWVDVQLLDAPAAAVLAVALRANSTLTSLALDNVAVWRDADAAAELLGALHGHASLRVLHLRCNDVEEAHQAAAGATLGALVVANAPSLTHLDVFGCDLGDDGLRPLFEALPANTHLRALACHANKATELFGRDVLLPAVRANTSLRKLDLRGWGSLLEAETLVTRRAFAP